MAARIASARLAAFHILRKIGLDHGNSDSLLHSRTVDALSSADRNLCTALVLGTLRWQRVLDAEYRRFLTRSDQRLADDAELALRLGAFQLLFLDRIPAHAAIFESVEWVKHSEASRQAGLVNAVLRKVAALPRSRSFDAKDAYPEWMVERWSRFYSDQACAKICEYGQRERRTALRLSNEAAETMLESFGIESSPGEFLSRARYAISVPQDLSLEKHGLLLQDEGSQLVAELLGMGPHILDCCAAPGGKTAVLRQNNPEAYLLACDVHPARLAAMQQRLSGQINLERTEFHLADAAKLADVGQFDRILCDVPCSGTGTLARNPEIRHRLSPKDLERHSQKQRAILSNMLRLLEPGGRLLYSTCSLEPEENEMVVAASLKSAPDTETQFRQLDLKSEFDRLEHQGIVQGPAVAALRAIAFCDGFLQTLPGVHPCDGFFAALIERV